MLDLVSQMALAFVIQIGLFTPNPFVLQLVTYVCSSVRLQLHLQRHSRRAQNITSLFNQMVE